MNLKTLCNFDLLARFGKLVQTERRITHLVLAYVAEIDLRKLYLERAYPSLYEFLIKEYGYSPSAAVRRIESARLLQEIPEVSQKLEEGSLNLSQLSKVQQAFRTAKKSQNQALRKSVSLNQSLRVEDSSSGIRPVITLQTKRELLKKIENTTQEQTENILAKELSIPKPTYEKQFVHRDESVTLTLTFSKEQMALLEKAQDLLAHAVPEKKWAELVAYLAQKEVKRRTETRKTKKEIQNITELEIQNKTGEENQREVLSPEDSAHWELTNEKSLSTPSQGSGIRKAIPVVLQKQVRKVYQCCQYRDPMTKKLCGSTRFLEIDHKHPVWAGGENTKENLTLLCSQHNKYKYKKESGLQPLRW